VKLEVGKTDYFLTGWNFHGSELALVDSSEQKYFVSHSLLFFAFSNPRRKVT
jgi:hypothetical protein